MKVNYGVAQSKDSSQYEFEFSQSIETNPLFIHKDRIQLSWENLSYTLKLKQDSRKILKEVSGYANPGEILAIMGSSGAGKTSLLSIISNQCNSSRKVKIEGIVKFNGKSIKNFKYNDYARFVMQEDILLPTLTARETIEFSYKLKCGGSASLMKEKVDKIVEELKLHKCQYDYIGGLITRGLSGGERKRVSIANEIIASPSILILDEPTSGLDSVSAKIVVNMLKNQSLLGRTIIIAIHQPSRTVYNMFDRLILMVAGHFAYQGPANQAKLHFDNLGFRCPERSHCSDHFMKMLYLKDSSKLESSERKKISVMLESYKINRMDKIPEYNVDISLVFNHSTSFYVQFMVLLKRAWINSYRNPLILGVKVFQAISLGIVVDILYRDIGHGMTRVENLKGVLYYSGMNLIALGSLSNSMTFPVEKPLFLKDYKESQYGICAYYFSKILSEVPSQIIPAIIFVIIYYFAIGLNTDSADKFFINLGFSVYSHMIGSLIGNFSGIISPSVVAAITIGPVVMTPLIIFGGYFSNNESYPDSFSWFRQVTPFSHYFQALCINEFRGKPLKSGVDPLKELNFTGSLWSRAINLFLIQIGTILCSLILLKILGERYKNR